MHGGCTCKVICPHIKDINMFSMMVIIIVIIIMIIGMIAAVLMLSTSQDVNISDELYMDIKLIRDSMINDSYLHRLLLIETISDKPEYISDPKMPSNIVTFDKMKTGMGYLGKSLTRSFGITISQKISALMKKRNEIIYNYYQIIRRSICDNGECKQILEILPMNEEGNSKIENTIDKAIIINGHKIKLENNDTMVSINKTLENISREITDTIASSSHIRDIDQSTNKKGPILHYQRLFNLLLMYDKELINQAKEYASKQYDISMNCNQSALELSKHISDEFAILIKESQYRLQTL